VAESQFDYDKIEKPGKFLRATLAVMFVDIVQFTKKGDNEALRNVVRGLQNAVMDVFADLEWDVAGPVTLNDAVMIPTGDGYGIGFEGTRVKDSEILEYAFVLSNRLKKEGTPIRTGISKGPCYVYKDANNRMNLAGWGIIDAERAMSCGDKNHILCTREFAKPLIDETGEKNLHDIGSYKIKGRNLQLFNYFSGTFGNETSPKKRK